LNAGWIIAALLTGWIIGVSMSYRKIRKTSQANVRALIDIVAQVQELRITLTDEDVVDLATDEGRKRFLETIQGKTKH